MVWYNIKRKIISERRNSTMKTAFQITKYSKQKDEMYLSDAFQHSIKVPKDSDMYKFMSKFNDDQISLRDIQLAMDSEEYQAVKDKFEFRTYKNEFSMSAQIGTRVSFYHMSSCQNIHGKHIYEYPNKQIGIFKFLSHNKIDMLDDKSARRISEHSKFIITKNSLDQEFPYHAQINIDNYGDVNGLLMLSFDSDVNIYGVGDILFTINVTELIVKI